MTFAVVLIGYLAGMSASGISLLPGGLGVVEPALILALVHGGASTASATAGALLYRMITWVLFTLIGWAVWAGRWGLARARHRLGQDATLTELPRRNVFMRCPDTDRGNALQVCPGSRCCGKGVCGCGNQDRRFVRNSRPASSLRGSAGWLKMRR